MQYSTLEGQFRPHLVKRYICALKQEDLGTFIIFIHADLIGAFVHSQMLWARCVGRACVPPSKAGNELWNTFMVKQVVRKKNVAQYFRAALNYVWQKLAFQRLSGCKKYLKQHSSLIFSLTSVLIVWCMYSYFDISALLGKIPCSHGSLQK